MFSLQCFHAVDYRKGIQSVKSPTGTSKIRKSSCWWVVTQPGVTAENDWLKKNIEKYRL